MESASRIEPQPKVVAVIPAFNEERFIASVVLTTRKYADAVIVVDDGSSDRTAELAEASGAHVVRMTINGGKGVALNAGFDASRKFNPEVVVVLDADAQHDPADIPSLAAPIINGEADVVVGSRFLHAKSEIPAWRQVGQRALNVATNVASGISITDTQSGYRAFSASALDRLRFHSKGLAVESEMQFVFKDLRVHEVPIVVQYLDGNKRNPVAHGLRVVDAILGLAARRRPLLFFTLFGTPLFLCGIWLAAVSMSNFSHTHQVPIGSFVAASGFLLAGLLLFVTGIMLNTFESMVRQIREDLSSLQVDFRNTREDAL